MQLAFEAWLGQNLGFALRDVGEGSVIGMSLRSGESPGRPGMRRVAMRVRSMAPN